MARKKKNLPALSSISIESVAAEGKSLARLKMRPDDETAIVTFIPFGAPGDVVDIQVDRKKHSFAEAHITRIVTPSPHRIEARCPHFTICGGCKWQHLPYEYQLQWKQQHVFDALTRIGKVEIPEITPILGSADIWEYRNKMEYTFSCKKWRTWEEVKSGAEFTDSSDALGFHIPGSFDKVLHIDTCYLQCDLGNKIRNFIYNFAEERHLTFYNIKENEGLLRTLMIRTASTGDVMVCMVFGEDDPQAIKMVMDAIHSEFPELRSLLYIINMKVNDSFADQEVCVYSGDEYIEEEMEGLKFRVNAKSFYQTNSRQAYELYKVARRFAGLDHKDDGGVLPLVYDLYTGTGTIANFVARNARQVIGIEYVEEAIADARVNSAVNGIDNTLFYAGDMKDVLTDEFVERHGRPDVMIIDPPRAGMHEDVVKVILNASPEVLVYVSCNPATQARDLALLDAKYRVTDIQPVDMFPHTHHVENVVRLVKRQL
ncbi:MAG: 23S rRNA (uracil(1939)-C(5))-methyltransferase RlmD [Muribaculaceae bacterium]|nr:23S rRNA (uracil(1939)-C(5))-methyltransferase RlmD [Muribaculaceae bacterium]